MDQFRPSDSEMLAALLERDPGRFEPTTAFRIAQHAAGDHLTVSSPVGVSPAPLAVSDFKRKGMMGSVRASMAGLLGPLGAMPPSYNELVMREERNRAHGFSSFFDLFTSRLAELFVDACEKYRLARRMRWSPDRSGNSFITALFALSGFGTARLKERVRPDDELILRFSGFFAAQTRNAVNLQAMLREFSGLPIQIELFKGRWLSIPVEERSRMGQPQGVQLGVNATAGAAIHDFGGSFRVVIGPVDYEDYRSLSPGSSNIDALFALTRLYVGPSLDFDIQIVLKKEHIPFCQLGQSGDPPRLGWNSWARVAAADRDSGDAVIVEPRVNRSPSKQGGAHAA
ncbi:type VI secretion system baseplate subunit TssG [Rhizobium sp. P40RR-XXII]|uniref:type VI secretion system baseplate subunit TssG n=1 Tax=unclassified Rhizobium TaxID=2613769 RepID=UPI0014566045|nr:MULTISPECIES: type VI secretion system baseplate subunit TssG [unclassified Rhizobium]NLR89260.1 type VI secretion system baseplate subunit TssG [Rhizobium sp. P28RR-XV]NLS20122.1 type VI secretion system baseplate subunit TssG [Rhizobium sp. P40RR-XXII]